MKYLALLLIGCSNPPTPKAVELDLCQARSAVRLLEVETGNTPAPGSTRAALEGAEDAFCATIGR